MRSRGVCTVNGGSSKHLTTDVTVSAEAVAEVQPSALAPDGLDAQLISQMVDRAKADGIKLTGHGQGGLLQQLTKRILESALEGEITDRLGHEKHEKAGSGYTRNGTRSKTVVTEVGPVVLEVPLRSHCHNPAHPADIHPAHDTQDVPASQQKTSEPQTVDRSGARFCGRGEVFPLLVVFEIAWLRSASLVAILSDVSSVPACSHSRLRNVEGCGNTSRGVFTGESLGSCSAS